MKFEDERREFLKSIEGGYSHKVFSANDCTSNLLNESKSEELEAAKIKVENMKASLLLISGGDDANWPAFKFSRQIMDRLDYHKYSYPYQHNLYPKAGHLIEPPYAPFCSYSFHKIMSGAILWGGEGHHHNIAQEHSWNNIIQFYKTTLSSARL